MSRSDQAPLEAASRPSLRHVARLAGVSAMTVSRALGNRPRVSAETRAAVRKIAAEIGYRPDPDVAKLMHHLRTRRKLVFQGSVCALTNRPPDMERDYVDAIVRGASQRANGLGYGFRLIHLDLTARPRERLGRILRNQGVEGILLLPMAERVDLGDLLDWRRFSVISATSSVVVPDVHRVTPHHYNNTLMLCERLAARGYRRIGLVIDETQDTRVNHAFVAAIMWHNRGITPDLPPLLYLGDEPTGLAAWVRSCRPDVIVTTAEHKCRLIAQLLGPRTMSRIALASTDTTPGSPWTGVDELPEEIGAVAIDTLAGMIQRGVKGIPAHTAATLIESGWCEGRSCPRRKRCIRMDQVR